MKARHIVGVERGFGPRHAFNAQEGTEAVPSELPSPPGPIAPVGYAGKAIAWVADQVRQGLLPDEALNEIKRDPTSIRSLAAYAEAAMSAGTLLSGGEGGKLPKGEMPLPKGGKLHPAAGDIRKAVDSYDFKDQHAGHSELAEDLGAIENLPKPLEQALQDYHDAVTDDREQWGERSGEPELYGDRLYKLATQHAAPEQ
jgi:hypothetical protein